MNIELWGTMALPVSRFSCFCFCFWTSSSSSGISASFRGLASPSVLLLTARGAREALQKPRPTPDRSPPFVTGGGRVEGTGTGCREVPGEVPCQQQGCQCHYTSSGLALRLTLSLPHVDVL